MFEFNLTDGKLMISSPYYETAFVSRDDEWNVFQVSTERYSFGTEHFINSVGLVQKITQAMMQNWKLYDEGTCPDGIIWDWKKNQLFRMLYKRVNQYRLEMLKTVDSKRLGLCKRVYAATGSNISNLPDWIFEDHYLLSDLHRFNYACAVLVDICNRGINSDYKDAVTNGAWRDWFEGKRSKATNIIMNKYPRMMPLANAPLVSDIEWEHPITNRRQLLFVMQVYRLNTHWWENQELRQSRVSNLLHVSQHCTPKEIKQCVFRLGEITGVKLSPNKAEDISKLVTYIYDGVCEDETVANAQTLNSFLKRAHEAHTSMYYRLQREAEQERLEMEGKLTQATALPPAPLPTDDNIVFLKTAYDVWYEGVVMQHCVGSYANRAVAGHSYLFHVEFNGYHATAEVTPDGYVAQVYGTRNTHNPACDYGRRVLDKWAKKIKAVA